MKWQSFHRLYFPQNDHKIITPSAFPERKLKAAVQEKNKLLSVF